MHQANIPQELRVQMDYDTTEFSKLVRALKPLVFREDEFYCALLGPDREQGILGRGRNPVEAIQDWEMRVHQRIGEPAADDEVARYVIDTMNAL